MPLDKTAVWAGLAAGGGGRGDAHAHRRQPRSLSEALRRQVIERYRGGMQELEGGAGRRGPMAVGAWIDTARADPRMAASGAALSSGWTRGDGT
jgi:hypothetical protein